MEKSVYAESRLFTAMAGILSDYYTFCRKEISVKRLTREYVLVYNSTVQGYNLDTTYGTAAQLRGLQKGFWSAAFAYPTERRKL